jgi:hypothetical protein
MKTHILFSILTALFLTACASNEGRKVSSTQDPEEQTEEYTKHERASGRDFDRQ